MYRVILTAPNLLTYMLSVSCTVAYTWHAQWYSNRANSRGVRSENHGHSIGLHVVKRVKVQNIAYKTFKIVCGWGFIPNPPGRAYTAPSHHLHGDSNTYTPTTLTTVTLCPMCPS